MHSNCRANAVRPASVIVSGGIRSDQDLRRAASFFDRGVAGAIVGRALYTGDVDLGPTLEMLACS